MDINFDELRFGCPLKFNDKFYDCFFQLSGAHVFEPGKNYVIPIVFLQPETILPYITSLDKIYLWEEKFFAEGSFLLNSNRFTPLFDEEKLNRKLITKESLLYKLRYDILKTYNVSYYKKFLEKIQNPYVHLVDNWSKNYQVKAISWNVIEPSFSYEIKDDENKWVVQLSKIYKYACLIKIENQVPAIITNKNKLNASDLKLYNSLTSSGFIILDKSILQERIEMDNSIVNRDQYIYSLLFCFSKKFPW